MVVAPLEANPTPEEQAGRLEACEAHLRKHHQLATAGTLIGATMHEINNRLSALTNFIYLASVSLQSPKRAAEFLQLANDELRRVGEISSRNLSFVRTDIEAKETDLVELVNAALRLHGDQISRKHINVVLRMAEDVVAPAKRGELLQVLVNLLLNAIEALSHSGNLYVRVSCHEGEAVITIADDGKGIPLAFRPSLFQSFKSNKEQGNGLGLWVVKQIVESHRGRISYRSRTAAVRSGTVFRVALPLNFAIVPVSFP